MAEQRPLVVRRFTFEFSVRPITIDVLVPEGVDEDSDELEAILRKAAGSIDVDDYADWEDAYEAEEEDGETRTPQAQEPPAEPQPKEAAGAEPATGD